MINCDNFRSDAFPGDIYFSGANILKYLLSYMKGHIVLIKKHGFETALLFCFTLLTLKVGTTKTYFQHYDLDIKSIYMLHYMCHWTGTFQQGYAYLRSHVLIKKYFYESNKN